ncbi:MAG TPA: hypothetical protein VHD31_00555 [Candidatus Paceibacterota bacterium]|nr:hypothetical protein [Candidatus Paceibacterota bacterium]
MKELLGVITVVLSVVGFIPYIRDTIKGKTKPHLFTYLIWAIVTALAFFGQQAAGAGPGAWTTGVMAILTIVVLILCFKYGTNDVTRLDIIFLVAALIAIIPWFLTSDPTLSVVIATFVDVCAFFPTIRKTFKDPSSETLISWILNLFRHGLAILALASFAVATYIYPAALLVMNAVVVSIILSRRKI